MTAVRSLLFLASLIVVVLGYGLVIVTFSRWMSRDTLLGIARSWSLVLLRLLKVLCGLDYRLAGLEHLSSQPCVLMAKHQSAWETIALPGILPVRQAWVLKQELMHVPVFGWALRAFHPIAIDRKAGRKAMRQLLDQGKAHLGSDASVLVFPEGTRVAVGARKPFTIGGALLAEKSQVAIVPIAHNAGVFWKRRGLRKLPGCIEVVIGPPIAPQGRSAQELNALAQEWINGCVDRLPRTPTPVTS